MSESAAIEIYGRVRPFKVNSKISVGSLVKKYDIEPPLNLDSDDERDSMPRIKFRIPRDETKGLINNSRENYDFRFDKIFDMDASQEEVFDVVAKDVVNSAMEGFNGTIFAYGQTGSGKTFTITGGAERYEDRGIIPRTLQYLFQQIAKRTDFHFEVQVSYLEIYNETGYDLLDNSRETKSLDDLPKVTIQEDTQERMHLRNLSSISSNSVEEALNLLFVGDTNRVMAETPSNPSSSRSHCIFIISVTSRRQGQESIRRSKLHIVDLAGSERVSKTGVDGTLLKEAKHINLSLHYLEQVIIALREKDLRKRTHIPYRNSMMTSVLRDSLGGNCKTKMIATIAVEDALIEESISTCRFAQRVALISNKVSVNEEMDPYLLIDKLKKEIERLQAELALLRGDQNIDEPISDYEIERVKKFVYEYIEDQSGQMSLVFGDFRKIQEAFKIFKMMALRKNSERLQVKPIQETRDSMDMTTNNQEIDRLKHLIQHRDNEISILIEQLNEYKLSGSPKRDRFNGSILSTDSANTLNDSTSLSLSSSLNSKSFDSFQQSHPSYDWIQNQRVALKSQYAEAKALGESANELRLEIKRLKEEFSNQDECIDGNIYNQLKYELSNVMKEYKTQYQSLKQKKQEIEHSQHLLEVAKQRIVKDFEIYSKSSAFGSNLSLWPTKANIHSSLNELHFKIEKKNSDRMVSQTSLNEDNIYEQGKLTENTKSTVSKDVEAFYKMRDSLFM